MTVITATRSPGETTTNRLVHHLRRNRIARDVTVSPQSRPPVCGMPDGAVLNIRTTNHGAENSSRVFSNGGCSESKRASLDAYLAQNSEGDTRLHVAIVQQLPLLACSLIGAVPHPSCLDVKNHDCQTALHVAVITRQASVLSWLVGGGADTSLRDRRGNTALHLACQMGDITCVKALTKCKSKTLESGDAKELKKPCQIEDVSSIKALTNSDNKALLKTFQIKEDVRSIKAVTRCKNKALGSRDAKTLKKPCQMEDLNNRQIEFVKAFIKPRESEDAKAFQKYSSTRENNVPRRSSQLQNVSCEETLTKHRDITKDFRSCCEEGMEIHPRKSDTKVPTGFTKTGDGGNASVRLKRGGEMLPRELSVVNYEGETCVHVAANHGHVDVLRWLVHCGADVNARDARSGNTVLHSALERRLDAVSRYLLKECEGVDFGARNYAGMTAWGRGTTPG